jgi:hypothetical protein
MAAPPSSDRVLLDGCCLLNLYAARRIEEILRALPARFAVAESVAAEALYVRRGGTGQDADDKNPVELQPLIDVGLLEVLRVEMAAEAASYVSFAAHLDDGEAMTCALALHRGATVATDDRKAFSVLGRLAPQVPILTTARLLRDWADSVKLPPSALKAVLTDVRQRARFAPGRHDPLQSWWLAALQA